MKQRKKHGLLINLLFNIIIPVIIMTKYNGEDALGPVWSLVIALCFPIAYGLYEFFQEKNVNFFSVLGFISVLLTGGIGILQLDPQYIAIKEAGVPLLIAIAIVVTMKTKYPLAEKFFGEVLDLPAINKGFKDAGIKRGFSSYINLATWLLVATFLFSSVLNYILAKIIVTSAPGTPEFTAEIGRMTALSYPVIALPSAAILVGVMIYLLYSVQKYTDLDMESVVKT